MYPIVMSCGLGGSLLGGFYFIAKWIMDKITSLMYSSVTINYDDDSFKNVLKFLQDKKFLDHDNVLYCKVKVSDEPWWESIFKRKSDKEAPECEFVPGAGFHSFYYNGRKVFVNHHQGQVLMCGWERKPTSQDKLTIMVMGTSVEPIKDFIKDAMEHSVQKDDGMVCIYELHRWGLGWTKA